MEISDEQSAIIGAPIEPMSVIACAGSGKTFTAIRRLAELRRNTKDSGGYIALLSFSNVAVNTFRREYEALGLRRGFHNRVEFDTIDGFIINNVLMPHARRTMGANRPPFLAMGRGGFLENYRVHSGEFPVDISKVEVNRINGEFCFFHSRHSKQISLEHRAAESAVVRLGKIGAYTHELGRYWSFRTLFERPEILHVFAKRYPHILVDEAQDIGTVHAAILDLLIRAGAKVSLVGDPNQAIYEFAGADGKFLRDFSSKYRVSERHLTTNFRSTSSILKIANYLVSRSDSSGRRDSPTGHGCFYVAYEAADQEHLVGAFATNVTASGLRLENSAVLCRGRTLVRELSGDPKMAGQGIVKLFAEAALLRERGRYGDAFTAVAAAVVPLLDVPDPAAFLQLVRTPSSEHRRVRRLVWAFVRDSEGGLPSPVLSALTEWHPRLVKALTLLTERVVAIMPELRTADAFRRRLAKTKLTEAPLVTKTSERKFPIRIDTVHQSKGESLDAVLYLATKEHVERLLEGSASELGRIGYVALTRARNIFWLGVPKAAMKHLKSPLDSAGFSEKNLHRLTVGETLPFPF